ncbi:hypothetical protein BGZ88_004651, partial [Linnemannia elongata]
MSLSNTRTKPKRKFGDELDPRIKKFLKASDDEDDNHSDKENSDPKVFKGQGPWLQNYAQYPVHVDVESGQDPDDNTFEKGNSGLNVLNGYEIWLQNNAQYLVEVEVVSGQDQDDNSPSFVPRHHDDSSTVNALTSRGEDLPSTNRLACQDQEGTPVQTPPIQLRATSGIEGLPPVDLTNTMAAQPQEPKGTISSPHEVDAAPDDVQEKTKDYLE